MIEATDKYETLEDFCPRCKERIFGFNPETGRKGPLQNHCQFKILLSSSTITEIGLCKRCFQEITDNEVRLVFEGIKKFWARQGYTKPLMDNWEVIDIYRDTVW